MHSGGKKPVRDHELKENGKRRNARGRPARNANSVPGILGEGRFFVDRRPRQTELQANAGC
jgi:hypothetical protein